VEAAATETAAMAATTATDGPAERSRPRPGGRDASGPRGRSASGPDRLTVLLLSVAAFLLVLALLASQLRSSTAIVPAHRVVVLRRIYETRVIESGPGASGAGGTSVSQSVSNSGPAAAPAAVSTRSS
jgi:hypothetical protein